jgi:hypothetical protein
VVKQGQRRWVDPPWFRGQSYLKIGWHWVTLALSRGYELVTSFHFAAEADPEPARASKKRPQTQPKLSVALECQDAAA